MIIFMPTSRVQAFVDPDEANDAPVTDYAGIHMTSAEEAVNSRKYVVITIKM